MMCYGAGILLENWISALDQKLPRPPPRIIESPVDPPKELEWERMPAAVFFALAFLQAYSLVLFIYKLPDSTKRIFSVLRSPVLVAVSTVYTSDVIMSVPGHFKRIWQGEPYSTDPIEFFSWAIDFLLV